MADNVPNEHSVQIEKEKTKRTFAYLGVLGVVGILVTLLFFQNVQKGSLELSDKGVKVNIEEITTDKPIIQQVRADSIVAEGETGKVTLTTSPIADSVVEQVELRHTSDLPVDSFVGKNLIDRKAGFVLSSERPLQWKVEHFDQGYETSDVPIVEMQAESGPRLIVRRYAANTDGGCGDLDCMIRHIVSNIHAGGAAITPPRITRDKDGRAALIVFKNTATNSDVYVKCVIQGSWWYEARVDIPVSTSKADRSQAIMSVTSFSAIAKP
jgi:hypothetical protein